MYLRKKALFIAVLISIFWAILTGLHIIRTITTVRDHIAQHIAHNIAQSAHCIFHTTVTDWSFLPPRIICRNTYALPKDLLTSPNNQACWSWHCKQISFNFSIFSLIFMQKVMVTVEVEDLTLYSHLENNTAAIGEHLQKLFLGKFANIAIIVKTFKITGGNIILHEPQNKALFTCSLAGISKKNGAHFKSAYYLSNGTIRYHEYCYINHLNGTIHAHFSQNKLLDAQFKLQAHALPNTHTPHPIYMDGEYQYDTWNIQAHNQENTGNLAIQSTPSEKKWQLSLSSTMLYTLAGIQPHTQYNDKVTLTGFLPHNTNTHYGSIHFEQLPIHGEWHYHNSAIHLDLTNTATITPSWSSWTAPARQQCIKSILQKDSFEATLNGILTNVSTKKERNFTGHLTLKNNQVQAQLSCAPYLFTGTGSYNPLNITISCIDKDKKSIGSLQIARKESSFAFTANTNYQELYPLLHEPYKSIFPGTGAIKTTGIIGFPHSSCQCTLTNGYIQLGKSYNSCQQLETAARFDASTNKLVLDNTHCTLHHGIICSPHIRIDFDNNGNLCYAHAPVSFNHCLVNWNENIGVCSGAFTLNHNTASTLQSQIVFEKTNVSGNLFQKLQQKNTLAHILATSPLNLNVTIETKKAIHITLPQLHAKVHVCMTAEGPLAAPRYSGIITLHHGMLYVGGTTFTITHGTIHVTPDNPENSFVTIQAHAHKSDHELTLHLIGTITQPSIKCTATPALSDQQIIALILAGSSETSLNTALPTLITQQIKNLIIQHASHAPSPDEPSQKIAFIPQFSSNRGTGLQGGIELDFGEQLKAKVKKNIDLQENFALELNYHMSDDLTIRAFKNEKGQLGGQANVRFRW